MTLLFTDSFDLYGSTSFGGNIFGIQDVYKNITNPSNLTISSSGFNNTGKGLQITSSTANLIPIPANIPGASFTVGCHFIYSTPAATCSFELFRALTTDGKLFQAGFRRTTDTSPTSQYYITNTSSLGNVSTSSSIFNSGAWNYVEWKITQRIDNPLNCDYQIYHNGVLVLTQSDIATFTSNQTWNYISLATGSVVPYNGTAATTIIDNVYLTDGELIGPLQISTTLPNADTDQKDFISAGSDNFPQVNSATSVTASSLSSINTGDKDYYSLSSYTLPNGRKIVGVQACGIASSSPNGNSKFKVNLKYDNVEVSSSIKTASNTGTTFSSTDIIRENPETNFAWSQDDVNNIQIGPENAT